MYVKDKKTVTIGENVFIGEGLIIKKTRLGKIKMLTETGIFMVNITKNKWYYYMDRDYKIRGFNEEILFHCKPVKKLKYKRKRYKNG